MARHPDVPIRPARADDIDAITACVDHAYRSYIERIGRPPAPMQLDYAEVVRSRAVHVAKVGAALAGVLVLQARDDRFVLENVAVDPAFQGRGIGRALLTFAETQAKAAGYDAITLYTHEKMTENRRLYRRLGYLETGRRIEQDYARIYLRKSLA